MDKATKEFLSCAFTDMKKTKNKYKKKYERK